MSKPNPRFAPRLAVLQTAALMRDLTPPASPW